MPVVKVLATIIAVLGVLAVGGRSTAAIAREPVPGAVGAQYRYIWTSTNRRQFTAAEYAALSGFSLVILQPPHGSSFQDWDAAARALERRNPHQRVFVNFLARIANGTFLRRWGSSFDDAWILRSSAGTKLANLRKGEARGWQVDLTNPGYRRFVERELAERMRSAPYDGVMLDSFHPYIVDDARGLSPVDASRLNAGLAALLGETRQTVGPGKPVFFNGLARGQTPDARRENRGFAFLGRASGAQDEFYCYLDSRNVFRDPQQTAADTAAYRRYAAAGKTILYSVKLRNDTARAAQAHVKRFCFANFLMGYVPGHSFIQFKEYGSQTKGPQIENSGSPEQRLPLGRPTGPPIRTGTLIQRRFAHGLVVVNLGATRTRRSAPVDLTVWNGDVRGRSLRRGESYTVPARDAIFLLSR